MSNYLRKTLALTLSLLMVLSTFSPVFGATASTDYDTHWAKEVIEAAMKSGVSKGYLDGSFKPDNTITRAEFFALVNNSFGFTEESNVTFIDVTNEAWYASVIAKADAAGYISGYPDGGIHPDSMITREEAASIMSRVQSLAANTNDIAFSDATSIADWSKVAVIAVSEAKIMNGYPNGNFKPRALITRAEALATVNNGYKYASAKDFVEVVYDKAGTYGSAKENTIINGNVVIKQAGITLQNMIVKGNLTIAKEVGSGDATLKSVTVEGSTYVNGGGEHSIYFINVNTGKVFIQKDDGPVRIVASGTSEIDEIVAGSSIKLEEVNMTGAGFEGITVEKSANSGVVITLTSVKCDSVDIKALGVTLNVDASSTVQEVTFDAINTVVKGAGVIANAIVNEGGITFEKAPTNMDTKPGVAAPVVTPPVVAPPVVAPPVVTPPVVTPPVVTPPVVTPTPVAVTGIVVAGNNEVGAILTATPTPLASTGSYQWKSSDTASGTFVNISGATSNTYLIAPEFSGKYIKVTFTANGNFTGSQTSVATSSIAASPAQILAAAKLAAHAALNEAFTTCIQSEYTTENWTILTGFKTAGYAAVDSCTTLSAITSAQTTAIAGMSGIAKIVVVPVEPVVTVANVATLEQFKAALANTVITTINITADITNIAERLIVDRAVTINGGMHQLSFTGAINGLSNGSRHGILVSANDVTINDLNVTMTALASWQGAYGIQVYNATGVVLNDFTGTGADAGLLVNASSVELTGITTVTGNEFGGIEVSKGTAVGLSNSALTVTGTLVNGTEVFGQPTIWLVTGQGAVTGAHVPATTNTTLKADQTQYYMDAVNAVAPVEPVVTVANVATLEQFKAALANTVITTINISADITNIAERLIVDRAVTINGGMHQLSFTGAINGLSYGSRHGILVSANDVTINDLNVTMTALALWQGAYGIQVYNATGVVLNDFTGTGADAGLLVNASSVELTGVTTVTGNEFGGIEVSKGTAAGLSNSALTVTGTLVNGTEVFGQPTIWLVTGQGAVTGAHVPAATNTTLKADQTQYYMDAANAVAPVVTVANVANLAELKAALADTVITTINITDDIPEIAERLLVDRAVTINGGMHQLSFTGAINGLSYGSRHGILVSANDVTINDLNVTMTALALWQGAYGIQVYNATGVVLNDFTATGADAGLLVNASSVELTGITTVTGNEFGGIEVSKGTAVGLSNSALTVTGTLVNGTEVFGQPTIWLVTGQGAVTGAHVPAATNTTLKVDQTQYYMDAANAVAPVVTVANVATLTELKAALANTVITTINITADITNIAERLIVDRAITINGGMHQLSFTSAINGLSYGSRHGILVSANDVTINDLNVTMTALALWQGAYGIQVYNATGVVLNDFTATGADAGLLVNASSVELTGITTVTGNEFGGIEVSKGTAVGLSNSALTVTGTLVNGTEVFGQPTIWLVTGQGAVTGAHVPATTNTTLKADQTQYYMDATNAVEPVVTVANVATLEQFKAALANTVITTINITADIPEIAERLLVDRAVTINGGMHQLSFTAAINGLSYGSRHGILVSANDVTINDLNVTMTTLALWQGAYGIQVYNATGVVLNDFTGTGADAGLLVNASSVELTGITTVTGNEFGGIEVSKGTAADLPNSALTVTGTLVNGTEVFGQPTIWLVTGQGAVTGAHVPATTNTTLKADQTQYYMTAENAVEVQQ